MLVSAFERESDRDPTSARGARCGAGRRRRYHSRGAARAGRQVTVRVASQIAIPRKTLSRSFATSNR